MLNQTSIHKLREVGIRAATSIAILLTLMFTPMATYADKTTDTTKVKTVHVKIDCPFFHIEIDTKKVTTTRDTTKVPCPKQSVAGSGTATVAGGQLVIALAKIDVQRSNTLRLDQESELSQNAARALGYERVILLPGQYDLGREQVLSISVRTEGPLTEGTSARKFEVAAQFASLNIDHSSRTAPGLGTRLTYNVVPNIALEAELNHFPEPNQGTSRLGSGRITQGLFGLKAGKRFETFGVFGKVRPGLVSFGQTILGSRFENGRFTSISGRTTHSALDVGGVVEFYPSRRLVTRFDIGDTIIRHPCPTPTFPFPTEGDLFNPCPLGPLTTIAPPPKQYLTEHNFQFNSSVGFRF